MAISSANISWFGPNQTGSPTNSFVYGFSSTLAQGSQPSQGGLSGTQSRQLLGIATLTLDGTTTTGLTANFIDGVQIPFTTVLFAPVLSVAAPATINGVANQAVYSGVGAYGQLAVGKSVTFAGFSNAGNNGTFTVVALTTSTIQVLNASSVAETNPAGTVSFNQATGAHVAGAFITRSLYSFNDVLDTAANTISVTETSVTQTGVVFSISSAGTTGQTLSVLVELIPNK